MRKKLLVALVAMTAFGTLSLTAVGPAGAQAHPRFHVVKPPKHHHTPNPRFH